MNERIGVALLSVVLLSALLLGACGPTATAEPTTIPAPVESPVPEATSPPPPTEAGKEEPVVLRSGLIQEPDCLNPFACSSHYWFIEMVYDTLTDVGTDCDLVPRSAESMELSEDGLTWTLKLREGASFSDGKPFDAYALEDFYDWFMSTELSQWYQGTMRAESWKAVDEHTLEFTTVEPVPTLPWYDGLWLWPLPAHIWEEFDDETVFGFDNYPPIGSGPYVMTEWVPGQHLIYDAREDYWAGPLPIDRIVIQTYSNWDSLVQALLAGEIDVTDGPLPPQFYDALEAAPNITVVERPPAWRYFLAFNMAAGGTKHPAIEDPIVREAIDTAIDKQKIIDIALLGHGIQCPTDWACSAATAYLRDPSLTVTPYDPAEANRLLEEAGYLDTDGDGVRETKDGQPLEFRLFYEVENPTMDAISRLIPEMLSPVGIRALVEGVEAATLTDTVLDVRDFDIALRYFLDEYIPSGGFDFYFTCWSAEAGSGALNDSGYCNPKLDELTQLLITTLDPEERQQISFEASHIVNQDRPVLYLAGENFIQAYRSDRFKFRHDFCSLGYGLRGTLSLMTAEVVK